MSNLQLLSRENEAVDWDAELAALVDAEQTAGYTEITAEAVEAGPTHLPYHDVPTVSSQLTPDHQAEFETAASPTPEADVVNANGLRACLGVVAFARAQVKAQQGAAGQTPAGNDVTELTAKEVVSEAPTKRSMGLAA